MTSQRHGDECYEEAETDGYYDLNIREMNSMCFVETRQPYEHNGRKAWMSGWFLSTGVQAMLDSDEWCAAHDGAEIRFHVEDNGVYGDGLRLNIEVQDGTIGESLPLASVRLSPRQAAVLAHALLCVAKMRDMP